VDIALASENGHVKMLISDDGQGYEVEQALAAGPGQRLGLASIRERAALVDGTVTIQSQPSEGTVIEVKVPAARPCDE
ncbi:MAG: hypothetical protein KDE28_24320, partial [Anaerolineales bacterium]|nr:hypothetical protein [Anaerolineales bacterium]